MIFMPIAYMDEAGTSALEPVSVVAAVIVLTESQAERTRAEIERVLDRHVPTSQREGYVFHAKDIFSGAGKNFAEWGDGGRWNIQREILALPKKLGLPVCFGFSRRSAAGTEAYEFSSIGRPEYFDHMMAFQGCVSAVNRLMERRGFVDSSLQLVAEDVEHMRTRLTHILNVLQWQDVFIPAEMLEHFEKHCADKEFSQGVWKSGRKIKEEIEFKPKNGDPILQIADALAFAARRWIAEQRNGDVLIDAAGIDWDIEEFRSPGSEIIVDFPRRAIEGALRKVTMLWGKKIWAARNSPWNRM